MCVFCKIIAGDIPCYKIYEDDKVIAFLDISAVTKGHTLVIPKLHFDNFFTIDQNIAAHLFVTAQKVTHLLKTKLHFDNMNIINNCGALAGQSVNHFHLHIIPIYSSDQSVLNFNSKDATNLSDVHRQITNN